MKKEKKSATLFDLIGGITDKKRKWESWSEPDQKKFSSFIVNRWLSMRMELTEIVNELQTYTVGQLSARDTYRLYYDLLPNTKSYSKYIKGKSEDKYDKLLVRQIAEHYQISSVEAVEYIDLLSKESCDRIISLYGYSDAERKKMLKGIR
jgi:hypothetical protein